MRRRSDHQDGALTKGQNPRSVQEDQAADHRPSAAGFGGDAGQTRFDLLDVGLVLKLGDPAPSLGVIANRATEKHLGAAVGTNHPSEG